MRVNFLFLNLLIVSACALPLDIAKDCGIPGIYANRECVELAFEKKWTSECKSEGYLKNQDSQFASLKECIHRKRILSVWDKWLSK